MSGITSIGFGGDKRNPTGLGFSGGGNPIQGAGQDNTQVALLTRCAEALEALRANLAPDNQFMIKAIFNGNAVGSQPVQSKLTGDFNGILNCLQRGVVNVFFGNPGSVYDLQLGPVANPTPTPLPWRTDRVVNFVVDSGSPTTAFGSIYITRS